MQKPAKLFVLSCFFVVVAAHGMVLVPVDRTVFADLSARPPVNAPVPPSPCPDAKPNPLPLPSSLDPNKLTDFQKVLFDFCKNGDYIKLGWCEDKAIRDTGPYINGQYYGTHPAVKIHYSPELMQWLVGGRRGEVPDGAMIIKEQYSPPAARYQGLAPDKMPKPQDWTIMIKDSKGSKDGWYWGEVWIGMTLDSYGYPFNVFNTGFGLYCVRCHTSAEKDLTFSALNNIKGYPGDPLTFRVDESWRDLPAVEKPPPCEQKPPAVSQAKPMRRLMHSPDQEPPSLKSAVESDP